MGDRVVKKTILSLAFFLSSCGLLSESEPDTATIHAEESAPGCELITAKRLADYKKVTESEIQSSIRCLDEKLDYAFDKLQGSIPGELSIPELQNLVRKKILKLPNEIEDWWSDIEIGLPLFHPEGRAAIARSTGKEILKLAKAHAGLYLEILRSHQEKNDIEWLERPSTWEALEAWTSLISSKFRLNLSQALHFARHSDSKQIEAAWLLKNTVLISDGEGDREDITGENIKKLLVTGIRSARAIPHFLQWTVARLVPQSLPAELESESVAFAEIWKTYFRENRFSPIDTGLLSWSLEQLDRRSQLFSLTGDLVRVSQRLSPKDRRYSGLHPIGLLPLLDQIPRVVRDMREAAPSFGACEYEYQCKVSLRKALTIPSLGQIALKGSQEFYFFSDPSVPTKRLDFPLRWSVAKERFLERALITKLFSVFDQDQDGLLSLEAESVEEIRDTMDLAFTFMRFISLENTAPAQSVEEQKVPGLVPIKPGPLSRALGLIGDRWMLDGNNDKKLNAEEFYSVVKIYNEIHEKAQSTYWGITAPRFFKKEQFDYSESVFKRKDFIKDLSESLFSRFPHLKSEIEGESPLSIESLFHALIGIPKRAPIQVYSQQSDTKVTITHYLEGADTLAPVAVITILDRLMLRCDSDENGLLDWRELDCASPLLLEGGLQTVSSSLIDIDPGPHDAARVLLSFLQSPGIPFTLGKLLIANGAVRTLQLDKDFQSLMKWIDTDMKITWDDLAKFVAGREYPIKAHRLWLKEAIRRYETCDLDKNGLLQGDKEISCFTEISVNKILKTLADVGGAQAQSVLIEDSPTIRVGLCLATQPQKQVDSLLYSLDVHSSPGRILNLLEEIVRRSVPLWELPD